MFCSQITHNPLSPFFFPSGGTAAVLFCCWMKQCFTGYGLLICRFWWQRCHRVPTVSPCQHFPLPHNARAFQLALCSCSQGPCWSGNWSSWNKLQKQNIKQNKNKKTKKTKSFLFYRAFCSRFLIPISSWCSLLQGHTKSYLGTTWRGLSWGKMVGKKVWDGNTSR